MSTQSTPITIEPIVSYPRQAEPGKTYLMTVDVRFPANTEEWPYDEEEHEIYCLLDTAPLFDNEELGESVIVLHRFGGTYGPAMFLLTANQFEMDEPAGSITLTLANRHLMPLQVFKLDRIRVSTKAATSSETVKVTRQQPVPINTEVEFKAQSAESDRPEAEAPPIQPASDTPPLPLPEGIKLRQSFSILPRVEQIAWSPDGKTLALTTGSAVIYLWEVETGQMRGTLQLPGDVLRLAWSPDSLSIAAALKEGQVWVDHVSLQGSPVLMRFEAGIVDLQWSPDGRWLAVASQDGAIYVRDSRIWRDSGFAMREPNNFPQCIAWSPAGASYLVAGYDNGDVITWDTNTWTKRRIYRGHVTAVNSVAISPSRVFIASGADDGTIRIFKIDSTDEDYRVALEEHAAPISSVCFSHDGKLLASKSIDGSMRLWESPNWKHVAVIYESAASGKWLPSPALAFHPNRMLLATRLTGEHTINLLEIGQAEVFRQATPDVTAKTSDVSIDNFVFFNGINGVTGGYLIPPIPMAAAAEMMGNWRPDAEEADKEKTISRIRQRTQQVTFGLPDFIDPEDFDETGWAIVFHKYEDPRVKAAMRRLYDHRLKMVRDDFGADDAEKIVQWIDDYDGETAREWLIKHKADFGTVEPTRMPYYILLVGSPERIPFKFGRWLGGGYAVGRLHFDQVADYESYVDSLIRYETEAGKPAPTNKDVIFWGPRQHDDGATKISSELLVKPLATDDTQVRIFRRLAKYGYTRKLIAPMDSTKRALLDVFHRKAGVPAPSMLFTASHGLVWPNGDARQAAMQGALLCQDYFGLSAGELKPEHYLSAADLSKDANVFGMVCFHFASYGAGTPAENRFALKAEKPVGVPDKPFFAQLPQALLKHPNGGALGVFGHVERGVLAPITTAGLGTWLQPFEQAIWTSLNGQPLGHALKAFVLRANESSRQLSGMLEESRVTNEELAELWLARNSDEEFILFGDPAARLRKEDLQSS